MSSRIKKPQKHPTPHSPPLHPSLPPPPRPPRQDRCSPPPARPPAPSPPSTAHPAARPPVPEALRSERAARLIPAEVAALAGAVCARARSPRKAATAPTASPHYRHVEALRPARRWHAFPSHSPHHTPARRTTLPSPRNRLESVHSLTNSLDGIGVATGGVNQETGVLGF